MELWTIPDFVGMTKQQLFDMSAKHILTTRVQSREADDGKCIYSGTGCGASPFLTADCRKLADAIEGATWRQLRRDARVPAHESEFVQDLQRAHDRVGYTDDFLVTWKQHMRTLARPLDLSTAVIDADDKQP